MTDEEPSSPARNLYAIAVSQSYFALRASLVFIEQTRDASGFEEQLYARDP